MKIFGILNITPDSFSDGGKYSDYAAAAKEMLAAGAFAIDIGAESTRPGAIPVSVEEEWRRLEAVLKSLSSSCGSTAGSPEILDRAALVQNDVNVSIDTRNPETARRALKYNNVKYLNDVSGFENPKMLELAACSGVNIIAMHSLTVPADKDIILTTPPVETLQSWIKTKFEKLTTAGISADKIIFDPGIGFGKNPAQSWEIITRAAELAETCHKLGAKILYGHSRKSFLGGDIAARDIETAKISADLQKSGVDYIRVHNVAINSSAIKQEKAN